MANIDDDSESFAWIPEEDFLTVVADPKARYFGAQLQERSLLPANAIHLGEIRFNDWLAQPAKV